jgi:hypothetical protein
MTGPKEAPNVVYTYWHGYLGLPRIRGHSGAMAHVRSGEHCGASNSCRLKTRACRWRRSICSMHLVDRSSRQPRQRRDRSG